MGGLSASRLWYYFVPSGTHMARWSPPRGLRRALGWETEVSEEWKRTSLSNNASPRFATKRTGPTVGLWATLASPVGPRRRIGKRPRPSTEFSFILPDFALARSRLLPLRTRNGWKRKLGKDGATAW